MKKITPFLWYDDQALAAAEYYVSVFKQARLGGVNRVGSQVQSVSFELEGQDFIAFNGGPHYRFTPAVSWFVDCADQAEIDYYWAKLGAGGREDRCGWLTDRFGLSWQVVPTILPELLGHPNPAKAQRAMTAMLGMAKLDIATLKQSVAD